MQIFIVFENVINHPSPTQSVLREVFDSQEKAKAFLDENVKQKKWYSGFITERQVK